MTTTVMGRATATETATAMSAVMATGRARVTGRATAWATAATATAARQGCHVYGAALSDYSLCWVGLV